MSDALDLRSSLWVKNRPDQFVEQKLGTDIVDKSEAHLALRLFS